MHDNYSQWEWHEREQELAREKLPRCQRCKQRIDEDYYYEIDGEILCESCMIEKYRKNTEDYIR